MSFKNDCEEIYGTTDLYHILHLDKNAKITTAQIKKAYYKQSIVWHPDRFASNADEQIKTNATRRFQIISKAYNILIDPEKRKLYDDMGILEDEAIFDENMDWRGLWRSMFKKVDLAEIEAYLVKYRGSKEQVADVKENYEKFKGNMNKILECVIHDDEDQVRLIIDDLIATGQVQPYDKYTKEPPAARERRRKRAEKEAKEVEAMQAKEKKKGREEHGLASMIALRQEQRAAQADKFFDGLLAKYGAQKGTKASKSGAQSQKRKADEQMEEDIEQEVSAADEEEEEPMTSNGRGAKRHIKKVKMGVPCRRVRK